MVILVVDDDPLVLDVFESMLKSRGYEVIPAADPQTATTLLSELKRDPDLLLVDVALAGASGIDYAAELRIRYPSIAVVFTTGYAHREAPARRSGMGEVLKKPFRPRELFGIIERAYGNRSKPS